MSHILVLGCNTNLQIKTISIHAQVLFARETEYTPKAYLKLQELQKELESVVLKYFSNIEESELLTKEDLYENKCILKMYP